MADASHAVRAPGGYEWWYFDAEDEATDTQIVAIFLHGFIFHPGYLRDYARYVRRPTKRLPPLPDDYACMYLCVYRGGKILTQSMTQFRADQYAAARDAVNVQLGPNTLSRQGDALKLTIANTPWKLTGRGPQLLDDQLLKAELTFTPTLPHPPQERRFLSRQMTGADHHWVIANPLCDVSGAIAIESTTGVAGETISFTGRGYHDHNYGTAPLGPGLSRWFWGRAMVGDRVVTFHYAVPRDQSLFAESHLVSADAAGVVEMNVQPEIAFDRRVLGLPYPSKANWPGVLTLREPRVIDASPFYLRLQYKAEIDGQPTTAFCEAAYPHRLRWPVLGRMIEMSIDKRALKKS
jgi:carotenoid 1,2-hydratase